MNMKKRIFVAADISAEARGRVSEYISELRREFAGLRVGWEKPEKLHLTLKFLGETDDAQLAELEKITEKIAENASPFNLQIAETGVFPSPRNARVLWIDFKDEQGNLARINKVLEAECENIGFARERRDFVPHLTIARLREPQKSHLLAEKHLQNEFEPVAFEVSEIVIYESKLQPAGSIYRTFSVKKFKN